jgi:steroid 5-alpha reductase family enzyme
MHDLTTLLLAGTTTVLGMMFLLWCLHLALKNAAVVDVGWTAGLGILAVLYAWLGTGWGPRRLAVLLMVGLWSARLTLHLVARVSSEPEDARYTEIRARWKTNLGIKFFAFFMFQGVLDLLLSTPYLIASRNAVVGVSVFELLGALIWVVAVIGEAMADWQLREFKADPANKGTVCRVGLWGWSRHPNYFFEWLIWVSFATFALGSPWGWLGIVCPMLMLYFLLRVTGIPATEAHAVKSRGESYRTYQREVSAFVPRPPKGSKAAE